MAIDTKLAFAVASLLALAACAPQDLGSSEEDLTDDDSAERSNDSIVGGTAATAYPEAALIDMYVDGQQFAICSGTVIAPRVVLTAGHCVQGINGWKVTTPFANKQIASATSAATFDWNTDSEFVDPNQHDVGLIFLSKAIKLTTYPTLATSGVAVGSKVQNIGRIDNGTASYSKLFIGPQVSVKNGANYGFPFDYATAETIQSGDSGGPVVAAGTHKIVAVNSGAGGGTQVLARVDLVNAWIQEQIKAHPDTTTPAPAPTDPCGGVTFEGQCDGKVVSWCENNKVQKVDCAKQNKTCGYDNANSYYNCK